MRRPSPIAAPGAVVLGWCAMAVLSAVDLELVTAERTLSLGDRVQLHAYAALQIVFLGLVCFGLVAIWERAASMWPALRAHAAPKVALAALSLAVGVLVTRRDLESVASRTGYHVVLWQLLFASGFAVGMAVAVWLGRVCARGGWRLLPILGGVGMVTAARAFVPAHYEDLFFLVMCGGAAMVGAGLLGARLGIHQPRLRMLLLALACVLASAAVVLRPNARVWQRWLRSALQEVVGVAPKARTQTRG